MNNAGSTTYMIGQKSFSSEGSEQPNLTLMVNEYLITTILIHSKENLDVQYCFMSIHRSRVFKKKSLDNVNPCNIEDPRNRSVLPINFTRNM